MDFTPQTYSKKDSSDISTVSQKKPVTTLPGHYLNRSIASTEPKLSMNPGTLSPTGHRDLHSSCSSITGVPGNKMVNTHSPEDHSPPDFSLKLRPHSEITEHLFSLLPFETAISDNPYLSRVWELASLKALTLQFIPELRERVPSFFKVNESSPIGMILEYTKQCDENFKSGPLASLESKLFSIRNEVSCPKDKLCEFLKNETTSLLNDVFNGKTIIGNRLETLSAACSNIMDRGFHPVITHEIYTDDNEESDDDLKTVFMVIPASQRCTLITTCGLSHPTQTTHVPARHILSLQARDLSPAQYMLKWLSALRDYFEKNYQPFIYENLHQLYTDELLKQQLEPFQESKIEKIRTRIRFVQIQEGAEHVDEFDSIEFQ